MQFVKVHSFRNNQALLRLSQVHSGVRPPLIVAEQMYRIQELPGVHQHDHRVLRVQLHVLRAEPVPNRRPADKFANREITGSS